MMEDSQSEKFEEKIEVDEIKSESEEGKLEAETQEKISALNIQPIKKSKEEKLKKKDDRSVEQVLKALSSLGTSEEKLAAICKKYADIVDENRKLQLQMKQYEKKIVSLQREKEQLQAEQGKTVLTRSRLESLCRELQKQNKQIKEESLQRVKEEEEKRKAVSGKFHSTLTEISHLMQQTNENSSKLRDENLEMHNKFKTICEEFELKEKQVEKMTQQLKLESQLAEAKLIKLKLEMVAEKELLENDKKQLLTELADYQQKYQELQKVEATLRNEISMYSTKYDKFQDALSKSNALYGVFQSEMQDMYGKIAKLEKETSVWRMKWENNNKILLQVSAEKHKKSSELSLAAKQLAQLQKLCRTLQADRLSLLMQLKNEGITPNLSGHRNSNAKNEPDSRTGENSKESSPSDPDGSVVFKDSKDHDDVSSPTNELDVIETAESKESTPEMDGTSEDGNDKKQDEINKTDCNPKTKKGKGVSKQRKK